MQRARHQPQHPRRLFRPDPSHDSDGDVHLQRRGLSGGPERRRQCCPNAAAYAAYGSTFWKQLDNDPVDVGHQIPACPPGPVSDRVLGDYPDPVGVCVASRSTAETSFGHYVSTIEIDWLSTDGRIARH